MTPSLFRTICTNLLENSPTIVFFSLLRFSNDLRLAGWVSAMVAVGVCAAYLFRVLKPHPILLGINLCMLLITPCTEVLLWIGRAELANMLIENAQSAVLTIVFLTILTRAIAKQKARLCSQPKGDRSVPKPSIFLVLLSFSTVIWSLAINASQLLEVGFPLLVLFITYRVLSARENRKGPSEAGNLFVIGTGLSTSNQLFDIST